MLVKREPLSWTDGISQFLFSLSDGLIRLGHDVVCVTSYDDNLDAIPGSYEFTHYPKIEALERHSAAVYNPRLAARLWRRHGTATVKRHQPDLILLNGALPFRFSRPTALVAHDLQARKLFGNAGRILFKAFTYRLVNQLIVTCPELIAPTAKDSLCSEKRFQVIPTCIDTRGYTPRPLSERPLMILHCGLQFYKRPMATLEAFGQMRNGAVRLVMVGRPDAAFEAGMARLPEAVRARVELPGIVSAGKLKELLATARVMSVPSEYDLPVASPTVLEALASHTPCVVSPSISKIVAAEGRNCFIERTPDGMASRFDELLANENAWSRRSSGCAETKLAFDSLTVARQYIQLAERLQN